MQLGFLVIILMSTKVSAKKKASVWSRIKHRFGGATDRVAQPMHTAHTLFSNAPAKSNPYTLFKTSVLPLNRRKKSVASVPAPTTPTDAFTRMFGPALFGHLHYADKDVVYI